MSRRSYGYRRHSKRYQDSSDGDVAVIDRETLPTLKEIPKASDPFVPAINADDEEVELKIGAGLKITAVDETLKALEKEEAEEPEQDTGELPNHLTGFMPTDNVKPAVSDTTPEEMVEPEE